MIGAAYIPSMRAEPERDRYKRYKLPDPGTGRIRSWTRATTLASTLADTYHLGKWRERMVLSGIAAKPGLLDSVPEIAEEAAHGDPDIHRPAKAALDIICDDAAREVGADDGAKLGTLLHLITEYADAGRLSEIKHLIPDALLPDIDAYTRTLDAAGITRHIDGIERITVNTAVDAAGTLDRIVTVPEGPLPIIGDLKTGKTVELAALEIAQQLAIYANSEWMWEDTSGQLKPMPEVNKKTALVFHLPVGKATCTIYEVDIEAGWAAAQVACEVRAMRRGSKKLLTPYNGGWPVPTAALIAQATDPGALIQIWRAHVNSGRPWSPELNAAAAARKVELLAAA